MEDNTTGKIIVVGFVIGLISLVGALLNAQSEGARRIRFVLGTLLVLGLMTFVTAAVGIGGLALVVVAGAVIAWIVRGFKS